MMRFFIVAALLWAAADGPRVFWGVVCVVADHVAARANDAVRWAHARYGAAVEAS